MACATTDPTENCYPLGPLGPPFSHPHTPEEDFCFCIPRTAFPFPDLVNLLSVIFFNKGRWVGLQFLRRKTIRRFFSLLLSHFGEFLLMNLPTSHQPPQRVCFSLASFLGQVLQKPHVPPRKIRFVLKILQASDIPFRGVSPLPLSCISLFGFPSRISCVRARSFFTPPPFLPFLQWSVLFPVGGFFGPNLC